MASVAPNTIDPFRETYQEPAKVFRMRMRLRTLIATELASADLISRKVDLHVFHCFRYTRDEQLEFTWAISPTCAPSLAIVYCSLQKLQMTTNSIDKLLRQNPLSTQYYMTIMRSTSFSMIDMRVLAETKALDLGQTGGL